MGRAVLAVSRPQLFTQANFYILQPLHFSSHRVKIEKKKELEVACYE